MVKPIDATESEPTPRRSASTRAWLGLAVLALPCLLYSMDLTVLNVAVPQLTAALRPTSTELLWIVDIYGFVVAGSLITMGTLGDRIGRRRLMLSGAVAFGAASVFAAFAETPAMLIAARALLGVAGATIAPSTLSLISNMFPDPRSRRFAVAIWVASFSAGGALGPIVGGVLLEHFWWGSVFLIAVPVMVLLLVIGPRVLPEFRDPGAGSIDLRSAALSIIGILAVIWGAKRVAVNGPTLSALAAIAIGVLVGAVFLRRQRRLAHPLLDVTLFRSRRFVVALMTYLVGAFAGFGMFLAIAQYLQLVLGLGPLEAGLWTAPSGGAFVIGSLVSPLVARRLGVVRVTVGGLAIATGGVLLFALLDRRSSIGHVAVAYVVFSLGLAFCFAVAVDLVVASARPERAGSAAAVAETGFELGGAVGIAVLGSIINAVYRSATAAGETAQTLGSSVATAEGLPDDARLALLDSARHAFTHGISIAAIVCAVALGVGAIAAARFLPTEPTNEGTGHG